MNVILSLNETNYIGISPFSCTIRCVDTFVMKQFCVQSFYASGARISTVTDVGPGVVGERRAADLRDVAEWPLPALEPRRDPEIERVKINSRMKALISRS